VQRRRAVGPLFIVGRARPESMPRQWWGRPRRPRAFGLVVTRRCICRLKLYGEPGRHSHHHDEKKLFEARTPQPPPPRKTNFFHHNTPARGGTPPCGRLPRAGRGALTCPRSLPLLVSRFPAGAEPPALCPHACSEQAAAHASTSHLLPTAQSILRVAS
jgi:hypothetical protein